MKWMNPHQDVPHASKRNKNERNQLHINVQVPRNEFQNTKLKA